jgi:hypothetical protein
VERQGDPRHTVGVQHHLQFPPAAVPVLGANDEHLWRTVTLQLIYQVSRRAWLGQFAPTECRGLVDYLDDNAFIASHLPVGQIPVERDARWVEVDDPDGVAVSLRGAMVTTIGFEITTGSGVVKDATVTTPSGEVERLG